MGVAKGLLEGLGSLLKLLVDLLKLSATFSPPGMLFNSMRYTFDSTFRTQINGNVAKAIRVAEALRAVIVEIALHPAQYASIFNVDSKAIGVAVGEEVGRELTAEVAKKSAREIGDWVGFIVGRVMFEVIFLLLTEGFGMAAQGAKAGGEGAGLAVRLAPRLERLLGGLAKLKAFLRARLGLRAAEEVAETGQLVEAVAATLRPRATVTQLRQMLSEPADLYVWGTREQNIAANEKIIFTGQTNPDAPPVIYLLKGRGGLEGTAYGKFKVVIDAKKKSGIGSLPGRAEEFKVDEIGIAEGLWFTHEDLLAAKAGQ